MTPYESAAAFLALVEAAYGTEGVALPPRRFVSASRADELGDAGCPALTVHVHGLSGGLPSSPTENRLPGLIAVRSVVLVARATVCVPTIKDGGGLPSPTEEDAAARKVSDALRALARAQAVVAANGLDGGTCQDVTVGQLTHAGVNAGVAGITLTLATQYAPTLPP